MDKSFALFLIFGMLMGIALGSPMNVQDAALVGDLAAGNAGLQSAGARGCNGGGPGGPNGRPTGPPPSTTTASSG